MSLTNNYILLIFYLKNTIDLLNNIKNRYLYTNLFLLNTGGVGALTIKNLTSVSAKHRMLEMA